MLAESKANADRAAAKAASAGEARDRVLASADAEVAVLEAKVARTRRELARYGEAFPSALRLGLTLLEQEREGLDDDQAARRAEVEAEIAALRPRVEAAERAPSPVGLAPCAGLVRIARKQWGDAWKVGDDVAEDDVICEIYPPENMEVRFGANETAVSRLAAGMPVRVTVPALGGRELAAVLDRVGGLGRDKATTRNRPPTGVVEFTAAARLDRVDPDLKPGMTALLAIERSRHDAVLHLPRSAVAGLRREGAAWTGTARRADGAAVTVTGRLAGDEVFIVETGLAEGDRVLEVRP